MGWAEEVGSVLQGGDGDVDDGYSEGVRHAETPELAREALADCAILIFKGQVEVAFRCADSVCLCSFGNIFFHVYTSKDCKLARSSQAISAEIYVVLCSQEQLSQVL